MAEDSTSREPGTSDHRQKKPRKRLKRILAQIRQQMEFYFSDSNIHKDRFIKQIIEQREDRYVPLSIFLNFNKIREHTDNLDLIGKALSTSSVLEISEDKQFVRRRTPYTEPKDVDDRTIYVECLPEDVDHDWLKRTFSIFGNVLYVSVPRYRTSNDLKGFAFVEFDSKEAVERACQSYSSVDPEDGKSQRFPKYNKQLLSLHRQLDATSDKNEERKLKRRRETVDSSSSEPSTAKRLKLSSESSDTETPDAKKLKKAKDADGKVGQKERKCRKRSGTDDNDGVTTTTTTKKVRRSLDTSAETFDASETDKRTVGASDSESKHGKGSHKRKRSEEDEATSAVTASDERKSVPPSTETAPPSTACTSACKSGKEDGEGAGAIRETKRVRISEQVEVKENVEVPHKKRRKKKKKRRDIKEKSEELKPHLKVLTKRAWMQLRAEYLRLQRNSMKALKASLRKRTKHSPRATETSEVPMDSYVENGGENKKPSTTLDFVPGVIIKVESKEEPLNRKELKEALLLVATIPYVDLQDGDRSGYVRCASAEDATRILASKPTKFEVSVIQGEEEQAYWKKIGADRERKRAVKVRSKKRGVQKLMERAEKTILASAPKKHIVFDD